MTVVGRLGACALVAGISFIAGLSSPYPAWASPTVAAPKVAAANPAPVAEPDRRVANRVDPRLEATSAHLERITRLLRGRVSADPQAIAKTRDEVQLGREIRDHLQGLRSLELTLQQTAVNERADMARMQVPEEARARFEAQDQTMRKRAQAFGLVAARLERALDAEDRGAIRAALDAMAKQLDATDVTRHQAFDASSLRAQRVTAERRAPARNRAELEQFLQRKLAGNTRQVDPLAAPSASFMAAGVATTLSPELTGDHETRITPDIQALADSLGHNPVRIYNWVRNEIDYVPTHGAIQGAALTLRSRQGNAADTNSLLVALLRASGIPARFAYGTVDVPVAQAVNWLKARDLNDAISEVQIGGIPSTLLKMNGQPYSLRLQHTWVEAYIDFTPSRGAINRTPDAWIAMDASFKQYAQVPTLDLQALSQWNPQAAADALKQGAQINADGSFTALNTTAFTAYRKEAMARLEQATDIGAFADPATTPGTYYIVASELPVISGTLPFAVSAANTRFTALPDSLKFFVEANLYAFPQDIALENPELSVRVATVDLEGQSLYVDYAAASDAEALALQSYAASNAASLPLSSFHVVPTLKVGATVLGQGGSVGMGTQQYWTVGVRDVRGNVSGSNQAYQFAAGSRLSFTPDLGGITESLAAAAVEGMTNTVELPVDQALHLAGIQYWALNDARAYEYAQAAGGHFIRMPSVGAFAAPMQVRYFFGVPRTGYFAGYATDVKADRLGIAHTDPTVALRLAAQMGANGSLSEGLTWDLLLNGHAGKSLSSSSILAWANRSHVPIYTITADNIDAILPKIQTTSDVLDEIRGAVAAGMHVIIPEREFSQGNVSAAGYVIIDPDTGTGVYRVDGGLNGAINWGCIAKALILKVLCETKFFAILKRRLAILGARFVAALGAEALLAAVCPPLLAAMAVIDAVMITLTIIQVAYEITTWVKQIQEGLENLTAEDLATLGVKAINDYACNYMPSCLGSMPFAAAANTYVNGKLGYAPGEAAPNGPSKGNPVSVGNGVKTQIEPDYEGEGPFPLEYTRTYLSHLPNGSPVGHKWLASYQQRLVLPDGATAMAAPEAIMAQRANGGWQQYNFRSGAYVTNGDNPERIERVTDGLARTTGWRLYVGDDSVESYDADGKLLSVSNRTGLKHTLSYNPAGQLLQVADDFGRSLRFEHDSTTGQVTAMIDPESRRTTYTYEDGALVRVTRPDSTFRVYHYETPGWPTLLTGITDERGIRFASWKYDDENRAIESTHVNGADKTTFSYGLNETTVTDARGAVTTYKFVRIYDTMRMVEATRPCSTCSAGGSSRIDYDANGNPALITDFRNNKTQVRANVRGLPEQVTEALGTPEQRTTSILWHPTWNLPATITEPSATGGSRVTSLEYDARGNLAKKTVTADGESRVWTYQNNAAGQVTQVDGPRTDVADITRYEYETATGNRTAVIDPAGLTTRFTRYDAHGHVLQMIDPNGLTTDYRYDARDRLIEAKISEVGGAVEVTGFRYNAVGLLERLTPPDGSALVFGYDDAQRLTSVTDALGNRVAYVLNAAGDQVREDTFDPSNSLTQTAHNVFDDLGRLRQAYGADPASARTFGYDENGNETSALSPLHSNATESGYDPLDRLISTLDPLRGEIAYRYDAQDNLRQVIDPRGLATKYDFNGRNELTTLTSPDTGVTRFTYDAAGNLSSRVDARSNGANYAYDASNRVKSITYSDETITYTYDEATGGAGAKGRLTTLADGSGRTRFVYDAQGRLIEKTQQLGADSNTAARKSVARTYANGLLQQITLPSGARIRYEYDSAARISKVKVNDVVVAGDLAYLPFGELKGWTTAAGAYSRTYDLDGRVSSFAREGGVVSLGYDESDRLVSALESSGKSDWAYRYNDRDQLTSADNASSVGPLGGASFGWDLDASGNRIVQRKSVGSVTTSTNYATQAASNRLASIDGIARQYDAGGNAVLVNGRTQVYSSRNRLVEVTSGATSVSRYAYNAFGERVCLATGGTCPSAAGPGASYVQFVYDDEGHLVGEYDSAGNLISEHVWIGDTPIAVLKPLSTVATHSGQVAGNVSVYFVQPDNVETPRVILNSLGQTVWSWDNAPFGDWDANSNPGGRGDFAYSLRFAGQRFDPATQSSYNYFRDYDPAIGRYLQSDPIGLDGGINTYAYVGSRPLEYVDPYGLVTLTLKIRPWWTRSEKAAARRKAKALQCGCDAGRLKKTKPGRGSKSAASLFAASGGTIPPGSDVDHIEDLQLGGCDCVSNMSPLKRRVNRSFGAQIAGQLRKVPDGTAITGICVLTGKAAGR
jgi:RHS repeat-associated protein